MSAIGAVAGGSAAPRAGFSGLSSDDFMKIVLEELGQQDPLQPSDTGALIEQLANIRAIQSDVDLEQSLNALVERNELASATGLIGRIVLGTSESGRETVDVVVSVLNTREGPVLNLANGQRMAINRVEEVIGGDLLTPPEDDPDGEGEEDTP